MCSDNCNRDVSQLNNSGFTMCSACIKSSLCDISAGTGAMMFESVCVGFLFCARWLHLHVILLKKRAHKTQRCFYFFCWMSAS